MLPFVWGTKILRGHFLSFSLHQDCLLYLITFTLLSYLSLKTKLQLVEVILLSFEASLYTCYIILVIVLTNQVGSC